MHVIIPARYDSTRLPGKPLRDVAGKSLIQRVYECALASGAARTIIATDDERIRDAALTFDAQVCMTARTRRSGTERIAEVVAELGLADNEIVVNLQGDEPLMPPELIRMVADRLGSDPQAAAATAMCAIAQRADMLDPNVVKVVCDRDGYALYFSRAPIPWQFNTEPGEGTQGVFRHIGLYAYRAGFLGRYVAWPPCPPERIERLEQLRILWHGERIIVCAAPSTPGPGVDTEADLQRVCEIFRAR
jgi:3-deoxy-manno-octulosonate cytidylyltransferase (CMP-KDO synthetase)